MSGTTGEEWAGRSFSLASLRFADDGERRMLAHPLVLEGDF
jgi:hypothetical protein